MKKNYLLGMFAMAAFAFVGCSQDEMVNESPDVNKTIEFGTYVGRDAQGRGVVLNDENLSNFGVFASYTGQTDWTVENGYNFMFNQKVQRDNINSSWTYNPIKYWPTTQGDKISFWAYAPYLSAPEKAISVTSLSTGSNTPEITYTLTPDNLGAAEDFTAATLMNVTKGGGTSLDNSDRTVNFELLHELSRISFWAQLDRDAYVDGPTSSNKTQVNITNITFGGTCFASKGIYSFSKDGGRGSWLLKINEGTKTLDITNLIVRSEESLGGYVVKGARLKTDDAVELFGLNNYLFHIPSNGVVGTANEGDVTITITYDIVTVDASLAEGHSVTRAVKSFALPKYALKQGQAYKYVLTFGLNELKLSASVASWQQEDVSNNVDWTITDIK